MAKANAKLLMLVDDEPAQKRLVGAIAARAGWRTIFADDAEAARDVLETEQGLLLDAVLIDQYGQGDTAVELIETLHARRPALPVLLLTANGSIELAVRAMRAGASDYLIKPIAPERLLGALDAAVSSRINVGELRPLAEKIKAVLGFDEIVGSAPQFRSALAIAAKAARSRVPVLIEGEPGVGKELIAEAIHAASPRAKKPWVVINCGAIPENSVDSELFGHERGAFTGAFERKVGRLQQADGGTVLLKNIAELPLETQAKLVRVLETGEIHPLGARVSRDIDVRLIGASGRPLIEEVAHGRFREDLYYRLNVVHVPVPPLRDRAGDVPALSRHMLARIAAQPGLRELGITDEALSLLMSFDWPGNVRQLQTALFRAAVLCEGEALTSADFPQIALQSHSNVTRLLAPVAGSGVTLFEADGHIRNLEEIEADVIRLAIGHYRGRMTEVARRLGIGRSTLYRKLGELGIGDVAA
ncbi:sigma-54 dependent transcriptional regulator [Sphingomonas sp.]|jgi:DNA-binding NtrC family response regulator|uniref:sigma-54-dependent transcriptional regulator n=1 Tax=Sphingomonas sp. TaxID=28214 RepID=UPI002DE3BD06|nr:sigma-54 dependent transcriptional regulator [Sphingomonas sp.]